MRNASIISLLLIILLFSACGKKVQTDTVIMYQDSLCYRGQLLKGKYSGYGVMSINDSIIYSGQWKNGKRQGHGTATDSLGRTINGIWNADTIVSGTITDSLGIYKGELNQKYQPDGHGIYNGNDGSYYDGNWTDGKRNHFGCSIESNGKVCTGEWKSDVYRGERLTYTSERIYGIDVSRYQHGKGRKKYPIYWNKVRITNLGKISNKRIAGNVDYKVSFAYIKSTEGISVKNKYYLSDYKQAKRNGIHCGAYHFFSLSSPADKQANYFLRNTRFSKGDFPPVLDVEPNDAQIRKIGGAKVLFNKIRTWMSIVQRRTGVRPILYVSQQFVNKYLSEAPDIKQKYLVWIARYGEYKPDVKLVFWQLSPDGKVNGIRGDVDINVFNGYKDQFDEFLNSERIK
ncbi:MAG: GH25 family lysozyme [Prevotellaceae bacterium]|nr:GH25 family lysozyme [Prevotellaceae bacterium]